MSILDAGNDTGNGVGSNLGGEGYEAIIDDRSPEQQIQDLGIEIVKVKVREKEETKVKEKEETKVKEKEETKVTWYKPDLRRAGKMPDDYISVNSLGITVSVEFSKKNYRPGF